MANITIKERINGIAFETLTAEDFDFLKERALKSIRKASANRKPTKTQEQNEVTKMDIANLLEDAEGPMTATEIANVLGLSSGQKASALLKQMVEAGEVVKTENAKREKGKATVFSLPAVEE